MSDFVSFLGVVKEAPEITEKSGKGKEMGGNRGSQFAIRSEAGFPAGGAMLFKRDVYKW